MTKNRHTEHSLSKLRKDPAFELVEKVEYFSPFPPPHGRRVDFAGIIDIIAVGPGRTIGVQSTSTGALSAHKAKLLASEATPILLRGGWEIWIYAWHKPGRIWECRTLQFQLPKEALDGAETESG